MIELWIEHGSIAGVFQHLFDPEMVTHHVLMLVLIPAFIVVGLYYDKEEKTISNLNELVMERTEKLERINEKFRDANEKWVSMTKNTDDTVMVVDGKGTIKYANRTVPPYKLEEVIGTSVFEYIPKGQHELKRKSLRKVFTDGKTDSYVLSSEIPKTGFMWFRTKVIPIKRDGNVVSSIEIVSDITERKRAKETLSQTMDKLALVNEKLGIVGKLTRHDVRNKLSAVTGNIYLAKQALPADSESVKYLNETESAFDQIERIFNFARIYEQLGVEELSDIDAGKCFDDAVSLVSSQNGIDFVNECRGLLVLADSMLSQLMFTLIDNSLRHGEKVSRIRIHHKVGEDLLKIFIEDDGVGIPKKEKEIIFKEGYGKGSGLGLHLVKLMCEVYGWTIKETGKQGKGAQFTITIPKEKYAIN
jgi:PAS domain S-box-containing protein